MYNGKKISVAIAAYNGEKFIEKQLLSIINQTVPPDEIIISDDGSKDSTVEIVKSISAELRGGINVVVLTDNPRHGIGGNYEWAITHSSGDYIFICGQDDVWMPEKVQCVLDAFLLQPDAEMICHDLILIDANDEQILDRAPYSLLKKLELKKEELIKVKREKYLEATVSFVLVSGPAVCISSELIKKSMPIPVDGAEDQWLQFCAVADDKCYYLNKVLTGYRIHNSVSRSIGMGVGERLRKIISKVKTANDNRYELIKLSRAAINYMNNASGKKTDFEAAYRTADRICDIGNKEIDAASSGRIVGAYKLIKLFCTDIRYRRTGRNAFLIHLANILIYSKEKRIRDLC